MVTAEVLKACTVTCQPGSVVEVTEQQFRALGGAVRYLPDDVEIKLLNPDTEPETVAAADIPEPVAAGVENAVESVETAPETGKKKASRKKG